MKDWKNLKSRSNTDGRTFVSQEDIEQEENMINALLIQSMIKKSAGIILILNIVVYAFLAYQSSSLEISKERVQKFGLYKKIGVFRESIFANWWQFFTNIFVHFNLEHLLINMFFLVLISYFFAVNIDDKEFLSAYLISGVLASFIIFILYPFESLVAGSSVSIFGLLGFIFYREIKTKREDAKEKRLVYLIITALIFALSSEKSYLLHFTGFLAGAALSKGFFEREKF